MKDIMIMFLRINLGDLVLVSSAYCCLIDGTKSF